MITGFKVFGTVASFIVPQLTFAQQISIPDILKDAELWKDFDDKMDTINHGITKLITKPTDMAIKEESCQAYEGADLRQLETYLKKTDDCRRLGNLYRTTTDQGQVRWVCIRHYKENYKRTRIEELIRQFEAIGGEFDREQDQAVVKQGLNVKKLCELLRKGFNIYKLSLIH
ncbi:unnamed protein product, partial [Didymodactylos carnosus]